MSSFAYVSLCPAICLCIFLRCYVFLCLSHFWPRAVPFVRPRIRLYVYMVIPLCPPLHTTRIFGVHLPLVYVMPPRSSFILLSFCPLDSLCSVYCFNHLLLPKLHSSCWLVSAFYFVGLNYTGPPPLEGLFWLAGTHFSFAIPACSRRFWLLQLESPGLVASVDMCHP